MLVETVGSDGGRWFRSQPLTVPATKLQYLYQGMNPNATGDCNALPWRLGLLTQTTSNW